MGNPRPLTPIAMGLLGGAFLLGLQQDWVEIPLITRPQVYRVVREMLPGNGSARMSCCCGWRIRSYATSGPAASTRNAAPPAVKAGWSRHPKTVVVVLN